MTASQPDRHAHPTEWVDERGVTLTAAGVERARRRLVEADERRSPEQLRLLREMLGLDEPAA
jgi:hypothetical protein